MVCEAIAENLLQKYVSFPTDSMLFKTMKEYGDFRTAVERLMAATFRLKRRKTHMVTTWTERVGIR
jgi:hypothetical protein